MKNRMKAILYNTILILSVGLLIACGGRKDRTSELESIDNLIAQLEAIPAKLESLNAKDIQLTVKTIKSDLKLLEKGYHGTMPTKDAFNMDKYKDIYHVYKRYDFEKMNRELEMTTKQLENLKELIKSKATKDKDGNVIDDEYVTKAFNTEKLYAEGLIKASNEIEEKKEGFYERFNNMKPYVDSLIMVMPTE